MGGYIGATAVGLVTTAADVQGDITSTDTTPELNLKNTSEEDTAVSYTHLTLPTKA